MKKLKKQYADEETFNKIENAFKSLRKQAKENEKNKDKEYYVFFSNEQLKRIFGLTDEEIEKTKDKRGKLIYSPTKKRWFARFYKK